MDPLGDTQIVRPAWLQETVAVCQVLVGRLVMGPMPRRRLVQRDLQRLPAPANAAETLTLRGLLTDLAIRLVRVDHARSPTVCEKSCCLTNLVPTLSKPECLTDPRAAFVDLVVTFTGQPTGPGIPLARRIKGLIDTRYAEHLTIPIIAGQLRRPITDVIRAFGDAYGLSVRTYLTWVRVRQASQLLLQTHLKVTLRSRP